MAESMDGIDPRAVLAGRRILVVEDEALVAMLIEDTLTDLGCEVVGPVASIGEALDLVQGGAVDGATLDINLGREEAYAIAETLEARGIRFLLMSGYAPENLSAPYTRWRMLQKPFSERALARSLAEVLTA
ncbi:MAG TPA: response regulator [Azospirillum sp.]|nr:response regulator [Azospirillum sp.]